MTAAVVEAGDGEGRRRLLSEPVPALLAAGFAVLLTMVVMVGFIQPMWSSRVMWLVLAAGIGLPLFAPLLRSPLARPAAAGVAWVAWCLLSAAASSRPAASFWGLYVWATGAVLVLACAALWAIGARSGPQGPLLVEKAIVVGAVVNGLVAMLEMVVDLHRFGIPRPGEQVSGLFANPAYLAAFLVGGSWLVVRRVGARPLFGGLLLFVLAAAIQLSAERLALLLLVLTCLVGCRRATRRTVLAVVAAAALGLATGYALAHAGAEDAPTSFGRVAGDLGMTARAESWLSARHAIAERPLLGYGPGRYNEATGPFRTLRMAQRQAPDEAYADAHNLVVEYAVTTGLPGLALFVAFVGLAFASARSHPALAGFAVLVFVAQLLQPQHVALTPIGFLALGAAAAKPSPPLGGLHRSLVGLGAVMGTAAAAVLAVGFVMSFRAATTGRLDAARTAQRLLPPWPEESLAVALRRYTDDQARGVPPDAAFARLLRAERAAAEIDPFDVNGWLRLGYDELQVHRYDEAAADLRRAIEINPWSTLAANGLGIAASETGKHDEAIRWFSRSLRAHPDQPAIEKALDDLSG